MADGRDGDAAANGGESGGDGKEGDSGTGDRDGGTGDREGENGGDGGGTGDRGDGNGAGGENGGGGRGDGDAGNGGDDGQSGDDEPTWIQTAVVILSVAFAVALFAYAGWQIVESPRAAVPEASVVGTESMPDGRVAVTVRLRNPTRVGLVSATVEANCTEPPPSAELTYVPASSNRTATLVCPAGTTGPDAAVVDWVSR